MTNEKQPIYIMPENVQRTLGRDAQRNNILAAKLVADSVKTTLGPKGMDKMLVDSTGNITVTNDGVTILEEMDIEHPAAKMMVEIARTQENEVGDGTTTAVMLAGKLLENAEFLLDKKIHPTVIIKGYKMAAKQSELILNQLAKQITPNETNILKQIAITAMTGKGAETAKEKLADLVVQAALQVGPNIEGIKIEKSKGLSIEDSQLIRGIILDKEKANIDMPPQVNNARIALIDFAVEIKNPEAEARISLTSPDQMQSFIEREESMLKTMAEKIINSGANVVFCQKGIDDIAQYYLAKKGIYACRRVARSDMEKLAAATGARIVSSLSELNSEQLGKAQAVKEVHNNEEKMTYVEGCENPKAVSILIHGGTSHVIDEVERAIKDGLGDVASVLKHGKIVAGAGAVEIELARNLRAYAPKVAGREQLGIIEFAKAIESIPEALAENAGLDPIDVITELKARHDANQPNAGINILTNQIQDSFQAGIIEPLKIKLQAISSASEVAMMILRIDDVLAASNASSSSKAGRGFSASRMPEMNEEY